MNLRRKRRSLDVELAPVHRWKVTFRIERRDVGVFLRASWCPNPVPHMDLNPPAAAPEAEITINVSAQRVERAEAYVQRQLARSGISCLAIRSERA